MVDLLVEAVVFAAALAIVSRLIINTAGDQ